MSQDSNDTSDRITATSTNILDGETESNTGRVDQNDKGNEKSMDIAIGLPKKPALCIYIIYYMQCYYSCFFFILYSCMSQDSNDASRSVTTTSTNAMNDETNANRVVQIATKQKKRKKNTDGQGGEPIIFTVPGTNGNNGKVIICANYFQFNSNCFRDSCRRLVRML